MHICYNVENIFLTNKKICFQVLKRRTRENLAHPRERPAGNRDLNHDPVLARDRNRAHAHAHAHIHRPNPDRSLDRARILDRARALSRVRRPSRAANHVLDPAVLNPGIRRDLDRNRDRARKRLQSHRRDLGRARDPSQDHYQDRDPPPVAVAVPLARAAKAARKANESRSMIDNAFLIYRSFPFESGNYLDRLYHLYRSTLKVFRLFRRALPPIYIMLIRCCLSTFCC